MVSHNAGGQMIGYLYQVRLALYLLLASNDTSYQISIEKYDDIAFDKNGTPEELIQAKHHVTSASLADTSTDLWRTLNVWSDAISNDIMLLDHTDFIIITTAIAPRNSIAELIQKENYDEALEQIIKVAKNGKSKTNADYYFKIASMDQSVLLKLIKRIKILSSNSNIVEVEKRIQYELRFSCNPKYVSLATERIEGWWFQECIRALTSDDMVIATYQSICSKVHEIANQYRDDNLPIEFWDIDSIDEASLDPKERLFLEQLRILQYQNKTLRLAIRDYYRASKQRSSWLRQGLIYVNDLDTYEKRLIDAWEHAFADMEEELSELGTPSDQEKIKAGRSLYKDVMHKDLRIRPGVDANFVMQGTYHHLANSLRVGWHVDFLEKLSCLLKGS